jgi:alanine-alpha-ketoisovalerate/valine-pyruvate aminotransferase
MAAQKAITALMRDANTQGSKKWTDAAREAINTAFGYEISAGNIELPKVDL